MLLKTDTIVYNWKDCLELKFDIFSKPSNYLDHFEDSRQAFISLERIWIHYVPNMQTILHMAALYQLYHTLKWETS